MTGSAHFVSQTKFRIPFSTKFAGFLKLCKFRRTLASFPWLSSAKISVVSWRNLLKFRRSCRIFKSFDVADLRSTFCW